MHIINNLYLALPHPALPYIGVVKIHTPVPAKIARFNISRRSLSALCSKRNRFCSRPAFRNVPLRLIFCCSAPRVLPRYRRSRCKNHHSHHFPSRPCFLFGLHQTLCAIGDGFTVRHTSLSTMPASLIAYQAQLERRWSGLRPRKLQVM